MIWTINGMSSKLLSFYSKGWQRTYSLTTLSGWDAITERKCVSIRSIQSRLVKALSVNIIRSFIIKQSSECKLD